MPCETVHEMRTYLYTSADDFSTSMDDIMFDIFHYMFGEDKNGKRINIEDINVSIFDHKKVKEVYCDIDDHLLHSFIVVVFDDIEGEQEWNFKSLDFTSKYNVVNALISRLEEDLILDQDSF